MYPAPVIPQPEWMEHASRYMEQETLAASTPMINFFMEKGLEEADRKELFATLQKLGPKKLRTLGDRLNPLVKENHSCRCHIWLLAQFGKLSRTKLNLVISYLPLFFLPGIPTEEYGTLLSILARMQPQQLKATVESVPNLDLWQLEIFSYLSPDQIRNYGPLFFKKRFYPLTLRVKWDIIEYAQMLDTLAPSIFWEGITNEQRLFIGDILLNKRIQSHEKLVKLLTTHKNILFTDDMDGHERAWVTGAFIKLNSSLNSTDLSAMHMMQLKKFLHGDMNGYERAWVLLSCAEILDNPPCLSDASFLGILENLGHFFPRRFTGYQVGYLMMTLGKLHPHIIQDLSSQRLSGFHVTGNTVSIHLETVRRHRSLKTMKIGGGRIALPMHLREKVRYRIR